MDEQTNPRELVANELNQLGALLTIAERNVKVMHWLYFDTDFVSVHHRKLIEVGEKRQVVCFCAFGDIIKSHFAT